MSLGGSNGNTTRIISPTPSSTLWEKMYDYSVKKSVLFAYAGDKLVNEESKVEEIS